MKNIILIAMVVLVAFSCKKEKVEQPIMEDGISDFAGLRFSVYDANRVDVLNPNNPGALNDIKLYVYNRDGVETLFYNENSINNLDTPNFNHKGYSVGPTNEVNLHRFGDTKPSVKDWLFGCYMSVDTLDLAAAPILEEEMHGQKLKFVLVNSKIRIQWNETNSDIVKVEIKMYHPSGNAFTRRVWVNGELKWEVQEDFNNKCFLTTTIK